MNTEFDFEALERLKSDLAAIRQNHVATMNHYASADRKGFWHQPSKKAEASRSSTATCVSALIRAGQWENKDGRWGASPDVAATLLKTPWESAGLRPDNPFTLSFIAESVLDLIENDEYVNSAEHKSIVVEQIAPILLQEIKTGTGPFAVPGAVGIKPYPPSAYLTQLAFRVLVRCRDHGLNLPDEVWRSVRSWARSEIDRQLALIATNSRIADPLQLAYAIVLSASATDDEGTSPEEKALVRGAIKNFFEQQQPDGFWRLSQPLFHYPDVGNAHCYEYEVFVQLLNADHLKTELLQYLSKLEITTGRLSHTSYDLPAPDGGRAVGWASGHHPQIEGPESWSTACVYDFAHSLDRLVAEAIRRSLFEELNCVYAPPQPWKEKAAGEFASGFLDASLSVDGSTRSLRETLWTSFVARIHATQADISNGGKFPDTTPMSAIFFGPPGTSKTKLAKMIADFLGWPLLSIDPSYLVQDGLEHLYARANRLFSMLASAEQVVVFLDEFDEMGRKRAGEREPLSRFITTLMLPKLAAINERRRIVFLLATNYVSNFDVAFSRSGRFDMILQVMPPSTDEKLNAPEWRDFLKPIVEQIQDPKKQRNVRTWLEDLTYNEVKQLVAKLENVQENLRYGEFRSAWENGTLQRLNGRKRWKQTSKEEEKFITIPAISRRSVRRGSAQGQRKRTRSRTKRKRAASRR